MYKTHSKCRACGSFDLAEVFTFDRPMPLANAFVAASEEREGFTPLRVLFCRNCTLAQLGETVNPDILYKNYAYVTSRSDTMLRHFDRLTKDIISENAIGSLLEVGSNDGLFLRYASKKGFDPVAGVDPAENLAPDAALNNQIVGFFDSAVIGKVSEKMEKVDNIIARHCFCHQEWKPFIETCELLSHKGTLVGIEVPYAPDLLARVEFDSIYQEHTSYLTLKSVVALLKGTMFHIHGVVRYGIHGGAVLIMLRRNDSGIVPHLSADEYLHEEHVTEDTWKDFGVRARMKIENLQNTVHELCDKGKIVSAFGASAKATVLINACRFTNKEVQFCTDNTPHKPGKLIPGTEIPVIEEGQMLSEHPDYALLTCWNFRVEVLQKMKKWSDRGGKWIIPDKSIEIV